MCDEMRFPPVYESEATREFRQKYLKTQNRLRANGIEFTRHYAASSACTPSRTSILTGHYPSLHGATQTYGSAKDPFDPGIFWLDPDSLPTLGDYFRTAGYRTYWRGKWHVSAADKVVPGTHTPLPSFNPTTGAPDPAAEELYTAADRLDPFGFSGWIGPEPHGSSPLDSGSSVPESQQGRDITYAQQTVKLIQELDQDQNSTPWLVVSSFVNPHDICLWGLWANSNYGPEFEFDTEDIVPFDKQNPGQQQLFEPELFKQTLNDDLTIKPGCQKTYQESYAKWIQPILENPATLNQYYRYYYQLHKNVDEEMGKVLEALLGSRFKDDTIVVFTSDHGDMLGAHGNQHQKFYQAYEETTRVPLIIWNPKLFSGSRTVEALTSHIDLMPTLLGLAGIDPIPIRDQLALDYSDAHPLVGRDLSPLILGQVDPASIDDPVFFMTDDDTCRGLNKDNWMGIAKDSVVQPNHVETVVARLDDGKVWKYTRYFDNPQFWSSPGTPGERGVQDVIQKQVDPNPKPDDPQPATVHIDVTVKVTPVPEEFEMYNVTDDPMELLNLYGQPAFSKQQAALARLLQKQCKEKRLIPCSGDVPGQPLCKQQACSK
jgi:choline-sulfatase